MSDQFHKTRSIERGGLGSKHEPYDVHGGDWRQSPEERRANSGVERVIELIKEAQEAETADFDAVLATWLVPSKSPPIEY